MFIRKNLKWLILLFIVWIIVFSIIALVINPDNKKTENAEETDSEQPTILEESEEKVEEPPKPKILNYIEIIDGCFPTIDETCVQAYSEMSTTSIALAPLRKGAVLLTEGLKENENGEKWYKVIFDEWLRYPNRLPKEMYVQINHAILFSHEGPHELVNTASTTESNKVIIVDRSDQKLYAYDGNILFMEESVSTGLNITPTPRGMFKIFRKTPSRYMQGPIPGISAKYYDLPGVPWNLYFTEQGGAIHGTYWHDNFGKQWSSGCVNMSPEISRKLYEWAEIGTNVLVRD